MLPAALCLVDISSETDRRVWDVLHSEHKDMPNNDITHIVLNVNLQLIREHEQYDVTVGTPSAIAVL